MQNTSATLYQQISSISGVLHLLIHIAMIVVLTIGWRRHRQAGFLVLLAWPILMSSSFLTMWLWYPTMQTVISKMFGPTADATLFIIVTNSVAMLVSSLLLCVGLGMLVFAKPRPVSGT